MSSASRRHLLRATAAAGLAGPLAGCFGGSDGATCEDGDGSFEPTVADDTGLPVGPFETGWPMYRGDPASTGHAALAGPEREVTRAWRYQPEYDGAGETWAVRSADRVFVSATGSPVLTAIDPTERSVEWRYEGLGSATTPAVGDGVVVVGGESGLHAVDAETGERRWRRTDERFVGTVVVADGTAYANPDIDGDGLLAVDVESGEVVWRNDALQLQHLGAVADGRLFVGEPLRALDVADGSELWRNEDVASPGRVAVRDGTAYAVGAPRVHAVDAEDGEEAWAVRGVSATYERPAVGPDAVAVPVGHEEAGGGHLLVLERESGDVRWCGNLGSRGVAPPVIGGDTVFVAADDLVQARALPDGEVRWTGRTGRGYGALCLADRTLFATAFGGRLEAFVEG